MPASRGAAEIVIEGDDAVYLGPGDVQGLGEQRLGSLIDIAEFLLQGVQHRQQRTLAIEAAPNELQRDLFIPMSLALCHGRRGCCSSYAAFRISCR